MNGIDTSNNANGENKIKSNGQVFTPDSIVNEMLDMTDKELAAYISGNENMSIDEISDDDYISYIVLEPTCGNGNFIIRELERKLIRVQKYTGKEQEIALLKAVSSIHGIELSPENAVATKLRMMEVIEKGSTPIFELEYKEAQSFKCGAFTLSDDLRKSLHYIIDRNIQCGDSLKRVKYLIKKVPSINDIWELSLDKYKLFDGLFSTNENISEELVLTQYDFENGLVAIRERTYANMHESIEKYQNTSNYVNYNQIYSLPLSNIYMSDEDNSDEDDFDF